MSENEYILLRDKYIKELSHFANDTRMGYRTAINNFGKFINFKNSFDPNDILDYLNSKNFMNLEISTQYLYKVKLARFCLWIGFRKKEIASLYNKKKDIKKTLKKSDLLTKEEVRLILTKMIRPIDKALFMLLLETKARKTEIRKLKI
jgi:integrase